MKDIGLTHPKGINKPSEPKAGPKPSMKPAKKGK